MIMTEQEKIELAARAGFVVWNYWPFDSKYTDEFERENWRNSMRAAIAVLRPIIRDEALEEAAKECEERSTAKYWCDDDPLGDAAAAIRNLKAKP